MLIDHIGIAVKSIKEAIDHWENVFQYERMTETIINTRQKVKVVFMQKDGSITIKLIEPSDKNSPIYKFAQRGGGLHHLCFKCDNLELKIVELQKAGLRVIAAPQPGEAFENENIAFLYGKHGLNIELIDTDKRASPLKMGHTTSGE